MPKSDLHQQIEAIALDRGAMCLSPELIRAVVLNSLLNAIEFGKRSPVLFPTGHEAVVGKFKSTTLGPDSLRAELVQGQDGFAVQIEPWFTVTVELQTKTEPAISFCTIDIDVGDTTLQLEGDGDLLYFRQSIPRTAANVHPSETRDDAIAAAGIDPDDLLRVEGAVAFVTGARLVSSALGEITPINLKRLFPALSFDGVLEFHAVAGSLLIIPERLALIGNPGCPKGDATTGVVIIPEAPVLIEDGANWGHRTYLPQISERRFIFAGAIASTYLPKRVLDVHFGKTTPALTFRDSGNGFIGYDVGVTAAIRGIDVTIDAAEGGLRLALDFATWGIATANIDVPCVGRVDLAQVKFQMPKDNGTASVEALLRLAVDTGGRLLVVCELTRLDLGEAQVDIQLFSKYLGMAGGKAAVIGFIVDAVIGRVIAHNLPGLVFDTIKEAVNQNFFILADLSGTLKYLKHTPNVPTFSGDGASALMGLTVDG